MNLEIAVYYGMDELETTALEIYLHWLELSHKIFPDYHHARIKRKGDPRKSYTYRYCYKLAIETKGLIPDYYFYIKAQLQILKLISKKGHYPLVTPACLVGNKAWKRWKLWERYYNSIKKISTTPIVIPNEKIIKELQDTKIFFIKTFKCLPTQKLIDEIIDNRNLFRFIILRQISPYYLVLSEFIENKIGNEIDDLLSFDLNSYRQDITEEVRQWFKKEFMEF
jgi:hypothetical protein